MYVFGGFTSTSTAFNDLWKLNLHSREWIRPLTTGTYPSPKAWSSMVAYKNKIIVYGGLTQPCVYHSMSQVVYLVVCAGLQELFLSIVWLYIQ